MFYTGHGRILRWFAIHPPACMVMKKSVYWVIATLSLATLVYYGSTSTRQDSDKGKKENIATVTYGTAHKENIDIYVDALGSVTPHNTVTLRSRVDGQLIRVLFQEGQSVTAGDVIAEIDPRTYEAQLKQAEGQKMKDEASLAEAKQTLERYKALFAKDSIPKQQLETQASLVKQYEGVVKNDQGAIDNASTLLDYTHIKAPISGRVGLRQVDVGNIVHTSDTTGIAVITEQDPISVLFSVPEDKIPALVQRMKQTPPPTVEAWNREKSTKLATGTLVALDNQVDQTTGTLKLRADFTNPDGALFPNQFVNIRLKLDTRNDGLIIPAAALQRGSKGTFVYSIKDDLTVEAKPVKVDIIEGESALVSSGIAENERVVKEGADSLRDGAKIVLKEKDTATPDKAATAGQEKPAESSPHKHHKQD